MSIAVFSCLLGVCVILGILNCFFDFTANWKNITFKNFFVLSVLIFALVNANLSSNYGALTLMTSLAIAILLIGQTFKFQNSQENNINSFGILESICLFTASIILAFANISLITFVPWGIITGICASLAFIMLFALIQKEQGFKQYALKFLQIIGPMIYFFQSLTSLFITNHILVCTLILVSSAFLLAKVIINVFSTSNNKLSQNLQDSFFAISIIVVATSIFLL